MPIFTATRDVIGLLRPRTYVNGSQFDALKCVSISQQPGAGGVKAEFEAPEYLFDTHRKTLSDGLVSVAMAGTFDGSDSGNPDFVGYVDVDNATLAGEQVTLSAVSITSFLGKVGIGDGDNVPVLTYPLVNPISGKPTKWTPRRILDDLLARLPSRYRSRISLGDAAVLNKTQLFDVPELEFRFEKYDAALEKLLALYGDVTFTERFVGNVAYLDFYRIQAAGNATNTVRLAKWDDIIESGADVEDLSHNPTTQDAITRIKAYGTKRRYILSVLNYGPVAEGNLVKGWNQALEAAVLKDPKSAKPGAPGYVPGMELVFRRFFLPALLRPYLKLKDLGIKRQAMADQDGPPYKVQVFKLPTLLALDESGNSVGTESMEGQLLKSIKLELDKGYFELGCVEDGMNVSLISPSTTGNWPYVTWVAAKIGITLCVEGSDWLVADTGPDTSSGILYDINQDGLYERIPRDDLTYVQFTNVGNPVKSATGADVEYGAYFFNEDTLAWQNYPAKVLVRDDTKKLETLAREALRAKNKRHHAFEVGVPYFTRAFRPGNRLIVDGQANWPSDRICITGVEYDLAGNRTQISADNVKPPYRRDAKV